MEPYPGAPSQRVEPLQAAPGRPWCDERRCTTAVVNAGAVAERVDEQLLPALYRLVGGSFHATPSQLGGLTLSRALVQALASPLAGLLGHYVNRVWVLAAGAGLWGTMTALFALTHSVGQGVPLWALNGLGLALLIPAAQSLTADYNCDERRGRAFGLLHMTGAMGALLGTLYATNIGRLRPLGVEGWRFAFLTVAAASWCVGALALALGVDPRYSRDARFRVERPARMPLRQALAEVWAIVRIPSFLIIVLQGIVGSMPWNGLVFLTLYYQLLGASDGAASLLLATFLAANALGGLLGGCVGDWAARHWPRHGRVVACQLSVGAGVPLSFLLFKGLPLESSAGSLLAHGGALVATGLLITWAATACNNPIFAEIVPPHMRNLIYAFDRSLEGAIAALGAPLVGLLAERAFGFEGSAALGPDVEANRRRAASLGNALLVFTALPWTLCTLAFSCLHFSYPRDKRRAQLAAAAELAEPGAPAVELVAAKERQHLVVEERNAEEAHAA